MRVVEFSGIFFAAGVVKIRDVAATSLLEQIMRRISNVQMFDADHICDWDVFDAALVTASMAYGTPKQRARTLVNEVMIRLAATTQIEEAIEKLGVKPWTKKVVYLVSGDRKETVVEAAQKIVEMAGGEDTDLDTDSATQKLKQLYGVEESMIKSVQARSEAEAVKLLVIQKIASTII